MPEIERIADVKAIIGECPLWDPKRQVLYWTDIRSGRMFRYDPERENYRGGSLYRVRGLGVKGREEFESNFAWPDR